MPFFSNVETQMPLETKKNVLYSMSYLLIFQVIQVIKITENLRKLVTVKQNLTPNGTSKRDLDIIYTIIESKQIFKRKKLLNKSELL